MLQVCSVYAEAIQSGHPPHLILDTTRSVVVSETVKAFSSALGLPTLSTSFGQQGDSQQWRNLDEQKRQYLLQIMPPLDIIPEIIRSIVIQMNISNAAVLYDDSFGKFLAHY